MTYEQCKKQAISDLAQYSYLKMSLSTLPPQIELSQSVKMADAADMDAASHSKQLKSRLETNMLKIRCIDAALNTLTDEEKDLLNSYYIFRQRAAVNNYARKNYTHRSCVYRRIHRALDRYILAYFGISPTK